MIDGVTTFMNGLICTTMISGVEIATLISGVFAWKIDGGPVRDTSILDVVRSCTS